MSKSFHVPIKITLTGSVTVEAKDQEAAFKKADDTMYWAYQAGAPEQHKAVSIMDYAIEVEGEELDLDAYREAEEE